MRKYMAPKKKQKRNKKVINKKISNNKQKKSNEFFLRFNKLISTIATKPFILLNFIINNIMAVAKNFIFHLFNLTKKTFKLLLGIKEAFFSILFGLLAGGIGAVVIFSYLDLDSQGKNAEYESKFLESQKIISLLQSEIKNNNIKIEEFENTISTFKNKLNISGFIYI